jgi:hypothetical protein
VYYGVKGEPIAPQGDFMRKPFVFAAVAVLGLSTYALQAPSATGG